jgi:hypothetical protein
LTLVRTKEAQLTTSGRLPTRPSENGCHHWGNFDTQKRGVSLPETPDPSVSAQQDFQFGQGNIAPW